MDRASLEQLLGRGLSLAEIGLRFDRHEATVAYWVDKHGLQAVNQQKHRARGALTREELQPLIERGPRSLRLPMLLNEARQRFATGCGSMT